jgi:long-subunit fatty acid transport protein
MLRRHRRLIASLTCGATLGATLVGGATAAHAGGFGTPEFGTRRTAMAATVARADDGSAVFHNPSGLSMLDGTHFYVSMGGAAIGTEFRIRPWGPDDPDTGEPESNAYVGAPVDADGYYPATSPERSFAVLPMLVAVHEILPEELWGAVSIYPVNATGAKFADSAVTRYHLKDGYIVAPVLSLSAAYKPLPWLSIGGSAGLMYLKLKGNRLLYPKLKPSPDAEVIDVEAIAGTQSELKLDGSGWGFQWNFGATVTPFDWLAVGLAVSGKVAPTMKGGFAIDYGDDSPRPDSGLSGTQETDFLIPWNFLAGVAIDVLPQLEVAVDFRYWLYSQYDEQTTRIFGLEDLGLTELRTPKNFNDSWQISGGVRVHGLERLPGWEFMLGVHQDQTPAPPETLTLDQPSFSHFGIHTGARVGFDRYRVALTWTHYWYDIPTLTSGSLGFPPLNFTAEGYNNIVSLVFEATL